MPSMRTPDLTPSIINLNPSSQALVDQANVRIAPWVMGALADLFLQGVLTAQMSNYFIYTGINYSSRRFIWLVLLIGGLCLIKSSQNIGIVWEMVIANFANPDVVVGIPSRDWWNYTTSFMTAIIAIVVQSFFVYRYWMLTKRLSICGLMLCGMLLSLTAALLVIMYLPRRDFHRVQVWSIVHFVSAVITDGLITCLTVYHLYRQKAVVRYTAEIPRSYDTRNGLTTMELQTVQTTTNLIDRLIWMIWQSALPPTVCVIINAILISALPWQMTHIAFNMALPKLYAISLMYTLNLRNEMHGEQYAVGDISRTTTGYDLEFSRNQALSRWNHSDTPNDTDTVTRGKDEWRSGVGRPGHLQQQGNGGSMGRTYIDTVVAKIGGSLEDDLELKSFQMAIIPTVNGDESDASSSRKAREPEG